MANSRGTNLLTFGSLHTGVAGPALEGELSPLSRNVENLFRGAVSARSGRTEQFRVAAQPGNHFVWGDPSEDLPGLDVMFITPVAGGGTLAAGTHTWKSTHVTSAGESDTRFSPETTSTQTLNSAALVRVRFHMRKQRVLQYTEEDGVYKLRLAADDFLTRPGGVGSWGTDAFDGWRVFSRDPTIQDETGLGANPDLEPLYHRISPLAVITFYTPGVTNTGGVFTLDRPIPNPERLDYVDIMMPDQAGLPIRAVNIYCKPVGASVYYKVGRVHGPGDYRVESVDLTATQCPETRLTRTAPTVTSAAITDVDPAVKGRNIVTKTRIKAGFLLLRYAWRTLTQDISSVPGYTARPRRLPVEMFPSTAAVIAVSDDHAITVTLPSTPEGVEDAVVYAKYLDPTATHTFSGVTNPSATSRAYKFTPGTVPADLATMSPSAFRALAGVSEYSTANYTSITTADDGNTLTRAGSSNRDQFEVKLTAGEVTSTYRALVRITIRATRLSNYTPVAADNLVLKLWNDGAATWTTIATLEPKDDWQTVRYGFTWAATMPEATRLVIMAFSNGGVGFEVDAVDLQRLDSPINAEYGDALVATDEFYQDEGRDTVILKHPLNESLGAIFPNTTGQWDADVFEWPIVQSESAPRGGLYRQIVACFDSLFIAINGELRRFYCEERDEDPVTNLPSLRIGLADWQMAVFDDRAFFCHPEHKDYNICFDLVATRRMGLEAPPLGAPGDIRIIEMAGEVDGDYPWMSTYEREVVRPDGFGYVVRSPASRIGEVRDAVGATVELLVERSRNPAATHVCVWRPITGGATFYRVGRLPIDQVPASGKIRFTDGHRDDDLAIILKEETGVPRAANHIAIFDSRIYLNPQVAPGAVDYSNVAGQHGLPDPEGISPRNSVVPKLPDAAAVTALAPYPSGVVVHSLRGAVVLNVLSDRFDGPASQFSRSLLGSAGACGPKAWANHGLDQFIIAPSGPAVVRGDEITGIQRNVSGTWTAAAKNSEYFRFARVWHYRTDAKSQVGFTLASTDSGVIDSALVLHLPESGNTDEGIAWREWRNIDTHGSKVTRDVVGVERHLVGDHNGRVHWADTGQTDNGRFIDWRHETKDMDVSGQNHAEAQRYLEVWFLEQGDRFPLLVEIYPDFNDVSRTNRPYRQNMGGRGLVKWGESGRYWDDTGLEWGEEHARRFARAALAIGGTYSRVRLAFYQSWEEWPVGTPREAEVLLAGFKIESYAHGRRQALKT